MANERYKLLYHEWVSTNNPNYPTQRELKEQTILFKTKPEAIEFYNFFKGEKDFMAVIDLASNNVIAATSFRFKEGHKCPFDEKVVIGSVECFMCPHHLEIDSGYIECRS